METVEIQFHKINGQIIYFYHAYDDILCYFYDNEYNLDFWSGKLEHDLDHMDGSSIWIKDYKDYYIMKFYTDFVSSKNDLDFSSLLSDLNSVLIMYHDNEVNEEYEYEYNCTFGGDEMWE